MKYTNLTFAEKNRITLVLLRYGFPLVNLRILKNPAGYVNNTFIVFQKAKKFVLRESHPSTHPNHLKLEVEVLNFLKKKRFKLTPQILPNAEGNFITISGKRFYLLQTFVPGELKAKWNDVKPFTRQRLVNFFTAMGRFAKVLIKFRPRIKTADKNLFYHLKNAKKTFRLLLKKIPHGQTRSLLVQNTRQIEKFITNGLKGLEEISYENLPRQLVHFDFHPGNVHFIGNKVTGLFDFDWVRFDSRFVDLASGLVQSCYYYGGARDGIYRKERLRTGIDVYLKAFGKSRFPPKSEKLIIKNIFQGYVVFQFLWAVNWYKEHPKSPEGFQVLNHFVNVIKRNSYDELFPRAWFDSRSL